MTDAPKSEAVSLTAVTGVVWEDDDGTTYRRSFSGGEGSA